MTFTAHGYHIHGTPAPPQGWIGARAKCGGPGICTKCSLEASQAVAAIMAPDIPLEKHDQNTPLKVLGALRQAGLDTDQALNAIQVMSDCGILFRERA